MKSIQMTFLSLIENKVMDRLLFNPYSVASSVVAYELYGEETDLLVQGWSPELKNTNGAKFLFTMPNKRKSIWHLPLSDEEEYYQYKGIKLERDIVDLAIKYSNGEYLSFEDQYFIYNKYVNIIETMELIKTTPNLKMLKYSSIEEYMKGILTTRSMLSEISYMISGNIRLGYLNIDPKYWAIIARLGNMMFEGILYLTDYDINRCIVHSCGKRMINNYGYDFIQLAKQIKSIVDPVFL